MGKKKGVMARQPPKDFVKVKNKVGKKKQAPLNETKTDYKVKQVQMPAQAALEEKGEEVTHRRLGLLELLAHMQHHSAKVRRDALRGLQELCTAHDGVLGKNLARIVESTTTAAIDSHAEVRQAFKNFQTWLLKALPSGALAAFAPALALQLRSALSHVSHEVRGDGLALLELYVASMAEVQVLGQEEVLRVVRILCQMQSHGETVLPCLFRLLQSHPTPSATAIATSTLTSTSNASGGSPLPVQPQQREVQTSLQSLLEGSVRQLASHDEEPTEQEAEAAAAGSESPLWSFCLRMWLQAGDLRSSSTSTSASDPAGKTAAEAIARPGWVKLRCAAVLERGLQAAYTGDKVKVELLPTATQVAQLTSIIRRGEWPLRVEQDGLLRQLAESANLYMARVCALVVTGAVRADANPYNLALMANAVLSFIEDFASSSFRPASGSVNSVNSLASAAAAGAGSELRQLGGPAAVVYVLRTLDLLWAASSRQAADAGRSVAGGLALGPKETQRLALGTIRFLARSIADEAGDGEGESVSVSIPALLSVPLAASLLGLRPSVAGRALKLPPGLLAAWPEALAAEGEPCLAHVLESSQPSAASEWVSSWPKLLWYLGRSDPTLSAFLLAMLLELAKAAARPGSLHSLLFAQACPLAVPFFVGRPGVEAASQAPPLALLPDATQKLAATLLQHFPKLTEPLLCLLTTLICRWSDAAPSEKSQEGGARLSRACCELLLDSLLKGPPLQVPDPFAARLRTSLTLLTLPPCSADSPTSQQSRGGEETLLHLADSVAGWLMDNPDNSETGSGPHACHVQELGYDDRRRLAFQTLAWPLCLHILRLVAWPSRALCFLFFCAARLPCGEASQDLPAGHLGWCGFLCELFRECLVERAASAFQPGQHVIGLGEALATPLCEPRRAGGLPWAGCALEPTRCLARLFVSTWMRSMAAVLRPAAYELLAKLCAGRLLALGGGGEVRGIASEAEKAGASSACAMVLAEAIAFRNEHSLPTTAWGGGALVGLGGLDGLEDALLATCKAEELRSRLRCLVQSLATGGLPRPPGMVALESLLSLL